MFLAASPSGDYHPMAFTGPVMSYYEKTTNDFDRLTDERWSALVSSGELPLRPDWVNIYLTDNSGNALGKGRELPKVIITAVSEQQETYPERFILSQNYPNPFNPITNICYNLPVHTNVRLSIYNILGQKIRTLVDCEQPAGDYEIQWNGTSEANIPVSSGIYLYSIETPKFTQIKRMILLK